MNKFIDDLAENALNSASLSIQTELEIDDGGYASMFFSDDEVRDKFIEYIKDEINNKIDELEEWFDNNPQTEGHEADYPQFAELNKLKSYLE